MLHYYSSDDDKIIEEMFDHFDSIVIYVSSHFEEVCDKIPGLSSKMIKDYPLNPLFDEIKEVYKTDKKEAICDMIFNIIIPLQKFRQFMKIIKTKEYNDILGQSIKRNISVYFCNYEKSLIERFRESFRKCNISFYYNVRENRFSYGPIEKLPKIQIRGFLTHDCDLGKFPSMLGYKAKNINEPILTNEEIAKEISYYSLYFGLLLSYMPFIPKDKGWGYMYESEYVKKAVLEIITTIIQPRNLWDEFELALRKCEYGTLIGRLPKPKKETAITETSNKPTDVIENKKVESPPPVIQHVIIQVKENELECCICYEVRPRLVAKECGHRCICRECSVYFINCPICQRETGWVQVYEA